MLTARILERTERAETSLHRLGFTDFRVRHKGETPVIEVTPDQLGLLYAEQDHISAILKECGYGTPRFLIKERLPSI